MVSNQKLSVLVIGQIGSKAEFQTALREEIREKLMKLIAAFCILSV